MLIGAGCKTSLTDDLGKTGWDLAIAAGPSRRAVTARLATLAAEGTHKHLELEAPLHLHSVGVGGGGSSTALVVVDPRAAEPERKSKSSKSKHKSNSHHNYLPGTMRFRLIGQEKVYNRPKYGSILTD